MKNETQDYDEIQDILGDDYAFDYVNEVAYVSNGNAYAYWCDYHDEEGVTDECIIGLRLVSDYVNADKTGEKDEI